MKVEAIIKPKLLHSVIKQSLLVRCVSDYLMQNIYIL